jgi:hypothetical protein
MYMTFIDSPYKPNTQNARDPWAFEGAQAQICAKGNHDTLENEKSKKKRKHVPAEDLFQRHDDYNKDGKMESAD